MHPRLLMAARVGDTQRLKDLLDEGSSVGAHLDFVVRVEVPQPSTATLLDVVTAVEGDSVLHVVAAGGDGEEFLESAKVIHDRAKHLLAMPNRKGDTPLHLAARIGNARMVSHLLDLAKTDEGIRLVKKLVRAKNRLGETALHEAVRVGHRGMVIRLVEEDSELAGFPRDGASPLYLAILLDEVSIARSLHDMSDGNLSYGGPNGQKALHAAVLRSEVLTVMLLRWNKSLTEQGDHDGCTPLHFAASQAEEQNCRISPHSKFPWVRLRTSTTTNIPLCRPIHVAAAVGASRTVSTLIGMSPDGAGLRDANGRTFLHVAVEKKRCNVVKQACRIPWILNMQDNDGNTALHLRIDLTNNNGQTPRDLSLVGIPPGLSYKWNPKQMIHRALTRASASRGVRRWDQFEEEYILRLRREDEETESQKLNNSTQTLGISSVLIVTVTFGGGAPTLAGRYTFDVFVVANALAFICSSLGTAGLMYSGITTVDLPIRQSHFLKSLFFVSSSLTSLVVVVIYRSIGRFQRMIDLARPLYVRAGIRPLLMPAKDVFTRMLRLYWPFIVIFSWAACARNHT
ncbi:hypothetical protein PVAP13_9NG269900 [Panicum virgatum]|uniref:PGG domain-containing protein n=1 Tax=Panicum virgatum TaxID=38727 RepID=A0A8T0MMW8_PANVG|nr:hypothetical protein PVAP13_9NG269900 [Panicum virgatum]